MQIKKFLSTTLLIAILTPIMTVGASNKATLINPFGDKKVVTVGSVEAKNYFKSNYRLMGNMIGSAAASPNANIKWVQSQAYTLAGSGAILGATTIVLKSFKALDGTNLTMSAFFGSQGFGTLEPNSTTKEEQITFTGVTQNANGTATLTGVKRVLMYYPYTETSGTEKTHSGGTIFVLSNTAGFYNTFVNKENDDTLNGKYTFLQNPYSTTTLPTDNRELTNKLYVDGVAVAGAPNISEITKGIGQLPTKSQAAAGTSVGSTGARLILPSSMATSSSDVATTSIPVTQTNGKLNQNFLDLTQSFSLTNTFSAASTTINGSLLLTGSSTVQTYPSASTSIATKGYIDQKAIINVSAGATASTSIKSSGWSDLNLSSIVGAQVRLVQLYFTSSDGACGVGFRRNGDTNDYNYANTAAAGAVNSSGSTVYGVTGGWIGTGFVTTDSSGIIEVKSSCITNGGQAYVLMFY